MASLILCWYWVGICLQNGAHWGKLNKIHSVVLIFLPFLKLVLLFAYDLRTFSWMYWVYLIFYMLLPVHNSSLKSPTAVILLSFRNAAITSRRLNCFNTPELKALWGIVYIKKSGRRSTFHQARKKGRVCSDRMSSACKDSSVRAD